MKIRRIVKRLAAVGTGVAMLGATAMGALAADLKDYPTMFVTNGTFNGFLVVGEKAAAIDNLAMTDIAASMKYNKPAAETSATTTVSGDAWKVGTSAKFLELANSTQSDTSIVGESFSSISSFIGSDELKALADGTWATNENSYAYQQFLYFDDTTGASSIVKYTENDNDVTGDHLFFKSGQEIARYKIEFSSTAQADINDANGAASTTGGYLTDFEDTTLKILGRDYTVVQARRLSPTTDNTNIKLTLMGGAASDSLQELEEKSYTVNGKEYQIKLSYVDQTYAKFIVNGESTAKIQDGDTYVLADKVEIGVNNILYQSYAGGIHSADFFIGAEKIVLADTDASAAVTGDAQLKVGSEDIDGTRVRITGTDNNVTFTISTIEVNMSADSDYWVVSGGKLTDAIVSQGDEKEVLMNGAFDVEYKGLTKETTHDIKLKTSSAKRYALEIYDGDGKVVDLPVAYADAQYNLSMGQESNGRGNNNREALVLKEGVSIYKDDYFVVTSGTDTAGSAKSYLLQYKGADSTGKTSPKIKFKNIGSAETLEYSATSMAIGNPATIKLGGYSFIAYNNSGADSDDYQILVSLDGSAAVGTNIVTFVDSYGPTVTFNYNQSNIGNSTDQDWVQMVISTENTDDYDTVKPATINLTITGITSDPEVRSAIRIDGGTSNLIMPNGVTDVAYGYTSMGTYITYGTPSSDPQYVTLAYPKKQLLPQVYVTSGATTSSTSTSGGTLTAVVVVDATKLDSEISDEKAQNLIVIGGPCVNTVSAKLLGSPAVCTEGFAPGKARVKLFEQTNGNVAMLVAGYSGADTRLAGSVIAHRASEMFGTEVEIEGTTSSDATISAPAPVVAAPVVEAPAAETPAAE